MSYPSVYPSANGRPDRVVAWDFLCLNSARAPEAVAIWFEVECERLEKLAVAKAANKRGGKPAVERADWTGYANVELTAEDKQKIREGFLADGEALSVIAQAVEDGHKVSLGYDPSNDTVTLAMTGQYVYCPNAGLTMTTFAKTLPDAIIVAAYKHMVKANGNWKPFVRGKREIEDFG